MAVVHVTKDNFDQVVMKAQGKVLVDFWATWCGPCKMLSPILEEIAAEQEDVVIAKVNIDEEMDLAMQFRVTSIPTLALVENGEVIGTSVGYRPKEDVLDFLSQG